MEMNGWRVLVGLVWLVACWLALIYVSLPLTLLAVAAGLPIGAVLAAVGYLRIYAGVENERVLIKPANTISRGSSAPYPYWDNGWPSYLTGQLERDILAALDWPTRQLRTLWRETGEWTHSRRKKLAVALPVVPPPVGFLVAVTAGAYSAWLALAAASEAFAVIPRLARWAAIATLRAGDASVRWWHGAAATCPSCRWVTRLPAYRCVSGRSDDIHRDLRPGRLGVWCRRCHCGARLPSTIMRAASVMTPVCPACDNLLHERAGAASDARIAVSGGPAVGKTQTASFGHGSHDRGRNAVAEVGAGRLLQYDLAVQFAIVDPIAPGWAFAHDGTGYADAADGTSSRTRYVHFIDVGGQYFFTAVSDPALRHLATTRRHLLVIDPTTIPSVRDRIDLVEAFEDSRRRGPAHRE